MGNTDAPTPPPGWYPDPRGTAGRSYWNGNNWGPPPPKDRRGLLIAGGVIGAGVLGLMIGSAGNGGNKPLPSTITSTVTAAAQPTTVMSTVTVTAQPTSVMAAPPGAW